MFVKKMEIVKKKLCLFNFGRVVIVVKENDLKSVLVSSNKL